MKAGTPQGRSDALDAGGQVVPEGGWAEDWETWGAAWLTLARQASARYDRFVFGDDAAAAARVLWDEGYGELAPPHCRAWVAQGQVAGVLACLPGSELARCRLQAALILRKAGLLPEATVRRGQQAAPSLVRPEPDDYYLSRLAVAAGWRRQGLGRLLLRRCEEAGRQAACTRVVLQAVDEPGTRAFYRRCGYVPVGQGTVAHSAGGPGFAYVHWAREMAREPEGDRKPCQ